MYVPVASRAKQLPFSPIRKFVPYAQAAEAAGKKVYYLNIGQPDIPTPPAFWDTLQSISKTVLEYDNSQGNSALIPVLKNYYNDSLGLNLENKHIQITNGGSEALIFAFFACMNQGDECLIFDPTYTNYISFAQMVGVTLVPTPLTVDNGFHFVDATLLEAKLTAKTKAILIPNPCNPTGRVLTEEERKSLVDFAVKHNLFLIVDEVYRNFVYDGRTESTFLSYAKDTGNVVIVDSLSKRYSVTGARVGALITTNTDVLEGVLKLAQARLASATLEQIACAAMVESFGKPELDKIVTEYQTRRDILFKGISQIPGAFCHKPEGAFYTVVKLPVNNAEHFAQWLLEEYSDNNETVFVAPATGFYATPNQGTDQVRIAYVLNGNDLTRAMEIITKALTVYPNPS